MSYINFIEKEYNDGKITLDEISKKREYYNSLDASEKSSIDRKYSSNFKKTPSEEKVENSVEDGALRGVLSENGVYYLFSILIACLYSFIKMSIDSGGDFDRFYRPGEMFFMNIFVILVIHLFIALPILVLSKSKFSKISFYTILIVSIISLMSNA